MIVAEIIPITSSILTDSLSYFSATNIKPGTLVSIPLRKKEIKGVVISTSEVKNLKQSLRTQNFKIKNIIKIHKKSIFSPEYLDIINQLKKYYILPAGKLISITYPKYILDNVEFFLSKSHEKIEAKPSIQTKFKTKLIQKEYQKRLLLYKKIIEEKFNKKKSIHFICPTIFEVDKLYNDLKLAFPNEIEKFHSKTTKKQLKAKYHKIKNQCSIIVSTPNFIDIPLYKKAIIIIEADSSLYYFRSAAPKIDMRIFIEEYAKKKKIELYFADSILRPLRFSEKENLSANSDINMQIFSPKKIKLISSIFKKPLKQTDAERIKDIDKKRAEFSPFSEQLFKKIEESIQKKENIFFYTTRKSLAPSIMCRDCGKLAQDQETKIPYSLFVKNREKREFYYIDRVSGKTIPAFDTCQFCGSWRLQTLGIGTESIREELQRKFPKIKTFIIDSEHTKNKSSIKKILSEKEEQNNQAKILIGTQLALPYLKNIDTSFIVSIDGIFYQQSFYNEERLLLLLKKIYDSSKITYVQTRNAPKQNIKKISSQKKIIKTSDKLQFKFSKRIENLVKSIQFSKEFSKNLSSRYTEALKVWEIIKNGDYTLFLKNKKTNCKSIIKITHLTKKNEYLNVIKYYKKNLMNYHFSLKVKNDSRKSFLKIITIIYLERNMWNTKKQDSYLQSLMPKENRNIQIEINPDILL